MFKIIAKGGESRNFRLYYNDVELKDIVSVDINKMVPNIPLSATVTVLIDSVNIEVEDVMIQDNRTRFKSDSDKEIEIDGVKYIASVKEQ